MKIKDMEVFLDLLNTQSPTNTANNFSITQPNVSIIIKNLENKLGSILFERLGKKLLPTPKALELGKNWMKLVQEYHKSLENLNEENTLLGEIKIASTQSICQHFLAPILFDFKTEFKNIIIHIQTHNSKECLHLVKNGDIEFAIIEAELNPDLTEYENLQIDFWKNDELVVATSNINLSKKEFYIDELLQQKWILREQGSGLRDKFLNEIGISIKKLNIFLELDSIAAIKELILQKQAISIFSKKSIEKELKNGMLYEIKLKNIDLKRKFYIVKRKDYNFNRALEKFEKMFK
ncbi:LysR family transcriptional regulator [Campylobacter hepaticus]|uniref:LysR family transcriptional regulator n=1 Tax=Campylobacter hepaticus TaxID=1813019 RepID=A0A424Z087_9BACT|nr:LysR family transcriptional regulator [Campylobacter hepaticus]AXP08500.1 LysR family transcriptional regulator [Campylobacter hepaticus]MCZ0772336.1 LysR family transcriptional regulator [Campylobacter hepaticus]MCZ0773804.1 LysR family transcriptional regulator [Campylobacter hepaticus]MCZ0775055.1 LysR family transcriptional regulator [Campylobacter hepaticus]MDX2330527.1 LysR family transcriptional regulator [Campylobacter hepaticus]